MVLASRPGIEVEVRGCRVTVLARCEDRRCTQKIRAGSAGALREDRNRFAGHPGCTLVPNDRGLD